MQEIFTDAIIVDINGKKERKNYLLSTGIPYPLLRSSYVIP